MALINCPECGKEVSDKAGSCPNCGCPISKPGSESGTEVKVGNTPAAQHPVTITKFSDKGFKFFSSGDEFVNLECTGCGKVFKYKKSLFSDVTRDSATTNVVLSCPNCSVTSISNKGDTRKQLGFLLISKSEGVPEHIECQGCNRDIRIEWLDSRKLFEEISKDSYRHKTEYQCPYCGNKAAGGQVLSPKPGIKQGTSFWGVVGAIIVALVLIGLIG